MNNEQPPRCDSCTGKLEKQESGWYVCDNCDKAVAPEFVE